MSAAAKPAAAPGAPPPRGSRLDELIDAVRSGDEAAVSATLALGGVDVNGRSGLGSTPLVAAAESGNVAMLRLLLQVGGWGCCWPAWEGSLAHLTAHGRAAPLLGLHGVCRGLLQRVQGVN